MIWDHENDIQGYFDHLIEACDKDIIIEGEGGEVSQQAFYKTCFEYLHDLIETPRCTTSFDSRTECAGEKTTKTTTISIDRILGESHLSQDTLNVVIIGAGPVGLFLASALTEYQRRIQNSAKHNVKVVVFESRLVQSGQKKLYSRDWMTDISRNFMDGTLNPRITDILSGLFDTEDSHRRISLPINALETLMLLSTRLDGAKFVFDDYHNYSYQLQSIPNLVVFDATGHRLSTLNRDGKPDLSLWRPVTYNNSSELSYSLTSTFVEEMQSSGDGLYIASLQTSQGTVSYPTLGQDHHMSGQPYNIYFLKMRLTTPFWYISARYDPFKTRNCERAPPICRYKDVVQEEETRFWCGPHFYYDMSYKYRKDIEYCMYNLRQDPGFNFLLALLNLTPEQFQTLEEAYVKCQQDHPGSFEMPLECLEKAKLSEIQNFGHWKVAEILSEINRVHNQYKEKMMTVAEPSWTTFVYRPYMYQDPLVPSGMISHLNLVPLMSEHIAPVLRAGESLLSGDPNASTGLETNMRIIRHFQCLLLDLPAEECDLPPDPSSQTKSNPRTKERNQPGVDASGGDDPKQNEEEFEDLVEALELFAKLNITISINMTMCINMHTLKNS